MKLKVLIDVSVSHLKSIVIGVERTDNKISGFPLETSAVVVSGLKSQVKRSVGDPSLVVVPVVILCGKKINRPFALAAVNLEYTFKE